MNLYLLPQDGDPTEVLEHLNRAGIKLLTPKRLYELVLETANLDYAVATISTKDLLVLSQHATTLLPDLPTCIHGAPGFVYMSEWITMSTPFPAIDWREMVEKVKKSGATGYDADTVEERTRAPVGRTVASIQEALGARHAREEDATGEDVVTAADL